LDIGEFDGNHFNAIGNEALNGVTLQRLSQNLLKEINQKLSG
jgi:hypothetical protein